MTLEGYTISVNCHYLAITRTIIFLVIGIGAWSKVPPNFLFFLSQIVLGNLVFEKKIRQNKKRNYLLWCALYMTTLLIINKKSPIIFRNVSSGEKRPSPDPNCWHRMSVICLETGDYWDWDDIKYVNTPSMRCWDPQCDDMNQRNREKRRWHKTEQGTTGGPSLWFMLIIWNNS